MRRALTAAAFGAFLVVQVALPALGLFETRPARFSWQMYSVAQAAPQAWGVTADGTRMPIDLAERLAVLRADTRDVTGVGHALCVGTAFKMVEVQLGDQPAEPIPCT